MSYKTADDPLFDVTQASIHAGVTPRMIRRMISQRDVAVTRVGKHVRIRRSALDEYLASQTTPANGGS